MSHRAQPITLVSAASQPDDVPVVFGEFPNAVEAHEIAKEIRHRLLHELQFLSNAVIHVDPTNAAGEKHHNIAEHEHDSPSRHSH